MEYQFIYRVQYRKRLASFDISCNRIYFSGVTPAFFSKVLPKYLKARDVLCNNCSNLDKNAK